MESSENERGRGTAAERERWCCKVIGKGREKGHIRPPFLLLFIRGPQMHQMTIIDPPQIGASLK